MALANTLLMMHDPALTSGFPDAPRRKETPNLFVAGPT
jgi:hypothetical protein